MDLPFDPEIPLPSIDFQNTKYINLKVCMHIYVHCSTYYYSKKWKHSHSQPQMNGSKSCVYVHSGILCNSNNKKVKFITMQMELDDLMLSEIFKKERDRE